MDLLSKLAKVADAWVEAQQRTDPGVSLKTLGSRAIGNSKVFDRKGMNVDTLERLARWLGDPANWPLALVPTESCLYLGELGVKVPPQGWMMNAAAAA